MTELLKGRLVTIRGAGAVTGLCVDVGYQPHETEGCFVLLLMYPSGQLVEWHSSEAMVHPEPVQVDWRERANSIRNRLREEREAGESEVD